jgi:SAM-dependent methyltransferase
MTPYIGRYPELYDIFYGDKPYAEEAAVVHRLLQKYGTDPTRYVLELACGTGSHAIVLETLGYSVVATDNSEGMLERARHKAGSSSSTVDFRQQDMRALDLGTRFDAAICLFDAIGYVETNQGVQQTLRGVHRHLRPGGLFVFEFWHAGAMLRSYDPLRVRRWLVPDGEVLRISQTDVNCAKQLCYVTYTIYELRTDGTYYGFKETHTNRYFLVQEMAGWLAACGFTPLKWFAGFSENEIIDQETWHIVGLARRRETD